MTVTCTYACCRHCWTGHHTHVGRDQHEIACDAPGGCAEGAVVIYRTADR